MDTKTKLILLLILPFSIFAQQEFRLNIENDVLFKSDNDYTHGTMLMYNRAIEDRETWFFGKTSSFESYTLSQFIYTPDDLTQKELIESDRPYAGIFSLNYSQYFKNKNRMESVSLLFGLSGPYSGSELAQKEFHKLIDATYPEGWHNQINTELLFNFGYRDQHRLYYDENFDFLSGYGFTVGNYVTEAFVDATFKFGHNIPPKMGVVRFEPYPRLLNKFYVYGFTSIEGKAVVHNIALDGNLFSSSHSVNKETFVGELSAGLVVSWKDVELIYDLAFRSKEFEGQDDYSRYGGLGISFAF